MTEPEKSEGRFEVTFDELAKTCGWGINESMAEEQLLLAAEKEAGVGRDKLIVSTQFDVRRNRAVVNWKRK